MTFVLPGFIDSCERLGASEHVNYCLGVSHNDIQKLETFCRRSQTYTDTMNFGNNGDDDNDNQKIELSTKLLSLVLRSQSAVLNILILSRLENWFRPHSYELSEPNIRFHRKWIRMEICEMGTNRWKTCHIQMEMRM